MQLELNCHVIDEISGGSPRYVSCVMLRLKQNQGGKFKVDKKLTKLKSALLVVTNVNSNKFTF